MRLKLEIHFKAGLRVLLFFLSRHSIGMFAKKKFAVILMLAVTGGFARINTDSLRKQIDLSDNDTIKAKCWNTLSLEYSYTGYYELAEIAAYEALDASRRSLFDRGIADAYYHLGISFSKRTQYDKAVEWFLKAISSYDNLKDEKGKAFSTMLIGVIDYYLKNYNKAEEEYNQALELCRKNNIKGGIANVTVNLGILYTDKGDYNKAIEYSKKAYALFKEGNSPHGMAECQANIANVYVIQFRLNDSLGKKDIAEEFRNRAVKAYQDNISTYKKLNMPVEHSQQYVNLFNLFLKGDPAKAEHYLDSAAVTIKEVNNLYSQSVVDYAYYQLFMAKKDSAKALQFFLKYSQLKDSVFNAEKAEKLKALTVQINEIEKQKEIHLLKKEKEKEQLILWGIAILAVFLVVFLFLLYRRYVENRRAHALLEEKNKTIEKKNKEILDSIRYAKRIQTALITSEKYIQRHIGKFIKFKS